MKNIGTNLTYKMYKGNPNEPGVTISNKGINFTIAVRDHAPCSLLIYRKGETLPIEEVDLSPIERLGDICAFEITGLKSDELEYNYKIEDKIVQDPYARVIVGKQPFGVVPQEDSMKEGHFHAPDLSVRQGGQMGVCITEVSEHLVRCGFSFDRYDWEEDKPLCIPYHNNVMYKLHPRGYTRQSNSKVRHKGTFLGLQEKLPYLTDLGINMVELMPAYEFDEVSNIGIKTPANPDRSLGSGSPSIQEKPNFLTMYSNVPNIVNYWGYTYGNYFAPKSSYCATDNYVKEYKDFIKASHKQGIEVIMEFFFPRTVSPRFIVECLRFWVTEYHIDGFHIIGDSFPIQMIAREPSLSKTKLMSVSFPVEDIYYEGYKPIYKNLGEYNEGFKVDMRKLLKGEEDQINSLLYRTKRNPDTHAVINYMVDNNGFTLMDLVSYNEKHNLDNQENNNDGNNYNYSWNCGIEGKTRSKKIIEFRRKQIKNALALTILSQGVPLIYAGDEFGNSQMGNNNAYCQDNVIGWTDWREEKRNPSIQEFTKKLIQFRKNHTILHTSKELSNVNKSASGYPDISYHGERAWYAKTDRTSRQIGILYSDSMSAKAKNNNEDDFIYIAYNLHWMPHSFALPKLPPKMKWCKAIDTGVMEDNGFYDNEPFLEDQKNVEVLERSVLVLIGR